MSMVIWCMSHDFDTLFTVCERPVASAPVHMHGASKSDKEHSNGMRHDVAIHSVNLIVYLTDVEGDDVNNNK